MLEMATIFSTQKIKPNHASVTKKVICIDLLVSVSAVTVFNCQYCALAALPRRRKHMQAQLVEACLLNPAPS